VDEWIEPVTGMGIGLVASVAISILMLFVMALAGSNDHGLDIIIWSFLVLCFAAGISATAWQGLYFCFGFSPALSIGIKLVLIGSFQEGVYIGFWTLASAFAGGLAYAFLRALYRLFSAGRPVSMSNEPAH
jgi:hypothetical protein